MLYHGGAVALRTAFSLLNVYSRQPATMFTLFPLLPADIRRKIWLATLGPMTLTFTSRGPPPARGRSDPEEARTKILTGESSYVGNVSLPDGSYKLYFVVKPSAAYLSCKESRGFLRYILAEPVKPEGGLPSWFDPAIDTVRFNRRELVPLSRHPWFKQTQYLWIQIWYDLEDYLGPGHNSSVPEFEDKKHWWLEANLASLTYITFEMVHVTGEGDWVTYWFPVFDTWFNHPRWDPVSFSARVICYQDDTPEDEWLTPQNYLRVEKKVTEIRYRRVFKVPNWRDMVQQKRARCLVYATDEELENPGDFLRKHQHFGQ